MTSMGLGGVQQSIVPYALALAGLGHELQLLLARGAGVLAPLEQAGLGKRVTLLRRRWKLFRYVANPQLRQELQAFGPDVVIGFAQMGFFEAYQAARSLGAPVITRVGSMKMRRLRTFRKADACLATTAEMRERLTEAGCPADRIFLVPNFLALPGHPREGYALGHPPVVGALGRFVPRKGFHVLVEAVALLRERGVDLRCEIAGSGKSLPELEKQVRDRGAGEYVRLVGWLDSAQKDAFLGRVDLFVSPSLDEPFGFVYLDAMRMGAPVITSPTVGARYIFSAPGTAEFVPFADPCALADAIEALLQDHARREQLGRAGAHTYAEGFSLAAGQRSLDEALRRTAELGSRRLR